MVFNYGETLRIRRDLYTILGKIRYIDTHGKIGYEYKLVSNLRLNSLAILMAVKISSALWA